MQDAPGNVVQVVSVNLAAAKYNYMSEDPA